MEPTALVTDPPIQAPTRPAGVSGFEDSLQSRTKVPCAAALALWEVEADELESELDRTKDILARFARAVADASVTGQAVDSFLQALDLTLISQDHNWRAIFATMRHQKVWSAGHKQAAMDRYLQYLGFRRRLLGFILERRASLDDTGNWRFAAARRAPAMAGATDGEACDEYLRLPEGEPVTLDLRQGRMVPLWLADNRFLLVASQPSSLLTDKGVQLYFPRHRNLVGRHPSADVPIGGDYINVSRAHALVEWASPFTVTITDLSANGTLLRRADHERFARPRPQAAG